MKPENTLVTASIGLFKHKDRFYLQTITADNYAFYHYEISVEEARSISMQESLRIETFAEMPKGIHLRKLHSSPI